MKIEVRSIVGPENIDATDEGVIFGLAIPYNQETTIGDMKHGGFREQIAPGACSKSLREADIVALFNHDSSKPLGRTSAGNLKLTNTPRGVEPELAPAKTSYAADLAALVSSGVIKGWSFGFEVVKDDWTDEEGRESNEFTGTNRVIREMKLIEVSPVTFPAYGGEMTNIAMRDAVVAARESRGRKYEDENRGGNAPGDGSKPYGNVDYADPGYQKDGKKRYPLNSAVHAKAAWSYINKAKNAGFYTAKQLASIKAKIKAAAKKFGINISEENEADLALEWRMYRKDYQIEESAESAEERRVGKRTICVTCSGPLTCRSCDGASDQESNSTADDDDVQTDNQGNELKSAQSKSEKRAVPKGMNKGTAKRIPQIDAILSQALALFAKADVDSLPEPAQQAVALVSSASTHASHIVHHEGMAPSDSVNSNDANGREEDDKSAEERTQPKPEKTTSTKLSDDDALRFACAQAISREVALGI